MGPVETRRGEGPLHLFSWYPPGVSPEAPSDIQVPRRSASAVRVLSSSSHECPEKISRQTFFFLPTRWEERGLCFRSRFYPVFTLNLSFANVNREVNHRGADSLKRTCPLGRWRDSWIRQTCAEKGNSSGIVIIGGTLHASDANGSNKSAPLIKTRVHACVERRYSLRLGKPDFYVWRTCSRGEAGGRGGASSLATGKSCLPIHTCVQGRPRREIAVDPELSLWVQWLLVRRRTIYLYVSLRITARVTCIYDRKRF